MYSVLDKDIIKSEIVPYLPLAKRGFQATVPLEEVHSSNKCNITHIA
jgi:hypothetical protein